MGGADHVGREEDALLDLEALATLLATGCQSESFKQEVSPASITNLREYAATPDADLTATVIVVLGARSTSHKKVVSFVFPRWYSGASDPFPTRRPIE